MSDAKREGREYEGSGSVVVVCFVALPVEAQESLAKIRDAIIAALGSSSFLLVPAAAKTPSGCEDSWLSHPEAANYLGVSQSTLYKYASQQTIECRKLGGRLQYRRSSLDRFKDRHIRPATPSLAPGRIIAAAPGSGK